MYTPIKLPYPFLTTYEVLRAEDSSPAKHTLSLVSQPAEGRQPPIPLHSDSLSWTDFIKAPADNFPKDSDNSAWARTRRSPSTSFEWPKNALPSLGQIWNVVHAILLAHPTYEHFRLNLIGEGKEVIETELLSTGLAIKHPIAPSKVSVPDSIAQPTELLVLRSSFWQGAASPTGPRPIWVIGEGTDGSMRTPLSQYPIMPENQHFTNKFPTEPVYTQHPVRRPKPQAGSLVYSRYVPELDEHFSLEVVNWQDQEHLELFNKWQNDPRVAKGWNETGTLDQHREYLRKLHFDPHVLCLFGRFDDTRFAYYELYWAKVNNFQKYGKLAWKVIDKPFILGRSLRGTLQSRRLRSRTTFTRWRCFLPWS